jgi:hypothetical protein
MRYCSEKSSVGGTVYPSEAPHPSRVVKATEAPSRLRELGLTIQMLQRSIEVGDNKRRLVSLPVYPATYPGVTMWAETLAELRRQLLKIRDGWEIGTTSNYATVYSTRRTLAIAVVAGDSAVGRDNIRDPRLTRKKGIKTTQRIERNARQFYIQGELFTIAEVVRTLPPDEACKTWFLMIHPTQSEVRIELSCPLSIDEEGIVSGWQERILLPSVPIAGAIAPISPDDDDDDDGGIGDGSMVSR